ncbi:general odorant-binding protein 57c [Drosophila montana]|uniref:general odorant-binding protein 57c n=1 Tax=Drosophila montana TaxID=40370 RepID=UPI00313A8D6A
MFDSTKNACAIIFLGFLLIAVQSASQDEVIDKCLDKNHIPKNQYEKLIKYGTVDQETGDIERKFKCFMHCIVNEMGVLDSDGYLSMKQVESLAELRDTDRIAFRKCNKKHHGEADLCEYAANIMTCVIAEQ